MTDSPDELKRRRIRSFVKRPGRVTEGQRRAFERLWPQYGLVTDGKALDLAAVFGRTAPCVLEIGYGNGDSLAAQASTERDHDFIGIEVHEPGIGHCMIAGEEAGLSNLRLLAEDAIDVLTKSIAPDALSRINLYFPDPWPKKKHHKRRIVGEPFLSLAARALCAGGRLHIATDWAPYAEHIDETMAACTLFKPLKRTLHDGDKPIARITTKFERRGLKLGHRIVDWVFEKA